MGFLSKKSSSTSNKAMPYATASRMPLQTRLSVSKSSDPAEKEADSVARKVADEQKANKVSKQAVGGGAEKDKVKTKKDESLKKKGNDDKKVAKKDEGADKIKKAPTKEEPKKAVQKKSQEKEKKKDVQKSDAGDDKKLAKKEDRNSDKKPVDKEKDSNVKPKTLNRKEEPGKNEKPAIRQKPKQESVATALNRAETINQGPAKDDPAQQEDAKLQAAEEKINAKRGSGKRMQSEVQTQMEQSFHFDFSDVRIHDDKESAELCASLNAHAFAIGSDIFFNTGKYDPFGDEGRELLAHELTHVVQQKEVVQKSVIHRNPAPAQTPANVGTDDGATLTLPVLELPKFKRRHSDLYPASFTLPKQTFGTASDPLNDTTSNEAPPAQTQGSNSQQPPRARSQQLQIWHDTVGPEVQKAVDSLKTRAAKPHVESGPQLYYAKWGEVKLFGAETDILENSKVPLWNSAAKVSAFDADHMLEKQLGGADRFTNLELLNFSANRSSGSLIANSIRRAIWKFINPNNSSVPLDQKNAQIRAMRRDRNIHFQSLTFTLETEKSQKGDGRDAYWTQQQIIGGVHLRQFTAMSRGEIEAVKGSALHPVAFTSPVGGALLRSDLLRRIPGFSGAIELDPSTAQGGGDTSAPVGHIQASINANPRIFEPMDNVRINLYKMNGVDFGGYMKRSDSGSTGATEENPTGGLIDILKRLRAKGLSPVVIDTAELQPDGIKARGRIVPTVKILEGLEIDFTIDGHDVELSRTFSAGDFKSIPPPFAITDASITVFGGTRGFGVRGNIDFEIENVGTGQITGSGDSNGVFELTGSFTFDPRLFDSDVRMKYTHREEGEDSWELQGSLRIGPKKLTGVRRAEVTVGYANNVLEAHGTADFNIPGIEHGSVDVTYANNQLVIEGQVDLQHKLIKSGNVRARVEKTGEDYKIALSGTAQPNIPGVEAEVSVSYENGAITIGGTVAYQKGRLSGSATVGVTNQAVGADGRPSGPPGRTLMAYGSGSLTLRITDWLQGTAGVTFTRDGNIEVVGRIGIPSEVEIFPKKEINKNIFTAPTIEIPLFAIPVGSRSIGLVGTIGGGLDAFANIGPGKLTDAMVEVRYSPAQEESMAVSGSARFVVPAEAGLRMYARAGIGLSVGIARVAGGIELAGTLGLAGAAEAAVAVNWSPTQGFKLDASAEVKVHPKFKFDINAYIEAVLDLWITEFSKEWNWNLASYEYGTDMEFGVKFPVHYAEGEPFDISLSDVEFTTPDVSVSDIAKGIGRTLLD